MNIKNVTFKVIGILLLLRIFGAGILMVQSYQAAHPSFAAWKEFKMENLQNDSTTYAHLIQTKYFPMLEQAQSTEAFDACMQQFEKYETANKASSVFTK